MNKIIGTLIAVAGGALCPELQDAAKELGQKIRDMK